MKNSEILLYSFLLFLVSVTLFKLYLSMRNVSHIDKNLSQVPPEFQDVVGHDDHLKAGKYTIAKSKFGQISMLFSTLLTVFWLFFGGLAKLDSLVSNLGYNQLMTGVILIIGFSVIQSIITLPFTIYSTFVVEEKFGFNKTTPKLFIIDLIKGGLISIVIGVPLIFTILWIFGSLGTFWWFYTWLFLISFQIVMVWAYPKFISPLFNKFSPVTDQELTKEIDELCSRAEVDFKDYYLMDASKRSSHGNAYFTGFGKNKRIVFFDTLIKTLNVEETIAVLAHELGHFKKKHIHQSILISFFSMLVAFYILGVLSSSDYFFEAFNLENSNAIALLLFMLITPYYTYFLTPIGSWFSRKNEFEADEFAAKNAKAQDLISALLKMYRDNSSTLTPDPVFSKFYFSHPPAKERIEFLSRF